MDLRALESLPHELKKRHVEVRFVDPQEPLHVRVAAAYRQIFRVNTAGKEGPRAAVMDVYDVWIAIDDRIEERGPEKDVRGNQISNSADQDGQREIAEKAKYTRD